jgi:hypothetical protein
MLLRIGSRIGIAGLLLLGLAGAQTLADNAQTLAHPALTQSAVIEGAALNWDALHFQLQRGRMALGGLASGNPVVAVFTGQGQLQVAAPNPMARQQFQFLTGQENLSLSFQAAVFRFADSGAFAAALGPGVVFRPLASASAGPFADVLADRSHFADNDELPDVARQLLALDAATPASAAGHSLLQAALKTDAGWVLASFDPLDSEAVEISRYAQNSAYGQNIFHDDLAHFPAGSAASAPPGADPSLPPPDRLDHYDLAVTIPNNLDMQAQASVGVTAARPGRGLLLALDSDLQLTAANLADGTAVEWLQPRDPGRDRPENYVGDWLYLRLPHALGVGQTVTLKLAYHGKQVIEKVGSGNFFARSGGWYPSNIYGPPFQRAQFHMRFANDKRYTLVATGQRVSDQRQGDDQVTEWDTPVPLTVAGFALGAYNQHTEEVALPGGQKVTLDVLVNKSPDDMLQSINEYSDLSMAPQGAAIPFGNVDPNRLAPVAAEQVGNALKFMAAYYGPYPYASLAVVPIPYSYGQGWPGLLYLSSLSFLDTSQLHYLGLSDAEQAQITDTFRAHETSHQWWGHRVSWKSYRDQWLSEGFANGSSLLFQMTLDGEDAGLKTLEGWRQELESKSRLGKVHEQDGPLWLGTRLMSSQDPDGYRIITYDKGGYVLYMLREMMLDTAAKNPDASFQAMMRDFTATFANRDASTADFQAVVEKHMTPVMDVERNHKMDWFFRQYVYGTGIPHVKFHAQVTADGAGAKLVMTIDNPGGWHGLLPVYIWQGKKFVRGQIAVRSEHETIPTSLGFHPSKIEANAFLDMLVDVDQ